MGELQLREDISPGGRTGASIVLNQN